MQNSNKNKKSKWLGQKVAIYEGDTREVGVVTTVCEDGVLLLSINGEDRFHHPKQCRLIKKKESPKYFVKFNDLISQESYDQTVFGDVRVVQVKIVK